MLRVSRSLLPSPAVRSFSRKSSSSSSSSSSPAPTSAAASSTSPSVGRVFAYEHDPLPSGKHSWLTPEQKLEMKLLRQADPERWTQKTLARYFNVSRLIVARYAKEPLVRRETRMQADAAATAEEEKKKIENKARLLEWYKTWRQKELQEKRGFRTK